MAHLQVLLTGRRGPSAVATTRRHARSVKHVCAHASTMSESSTWKTKTLTTLPALRSQLRPRTLEAVAEGGSRGKWGGACRAGHQHAQPPNPNQAASTSLGPAAPRSGCS